MKKSILKISIIASFAFITSLIMFQGIAVIAEQDGEIDGELTSSNYNNRARVIDFDLLDASGSSIGANPIDPNTNVTAQVTVEDPDTLDDLNSIKFFFHYDETSPVNTPGALGLDTSSVTDLTGDRFVFEWTRTSGAISVLGSTTGQGSTWDVVSSTVPAVYTATTFTFEIEFTVSKVAPATTANQWYFGTDINDGKESLDSGVEPNNIIDEGLLVGTGSSITAAPSGFDMNFFGEISFAQSNLSWSAVRAGDTFDSASSAATLSGITFISNDTYITNIKSSEIWEAVITQETVNEIISGTAVDDSDVIEAFTDNYNANFTPKISTTGAISDLIGVTYADANTVINNISVSSVSWASIEFLLPQPSTGANLTGAALVTEAGVIDELGFTEQFFMLGYEGNDLSLTNSVGTKGLLGTGTDWREFYPNGITSDPSRTFESGDTEAVTLYLQLSSVFQNAQYSGSIALQITNSAGD